MAYSHKLCVCVSCGSLIRRKMRMRAVWGSVFHKCTPVCVYARESAYETLLFRTVCLGVYCTLGSGLVIKYWECLNNMLGPGAIDRAHEQVTQRHAGLSVSVTWTCASHIYFHQLTLCVIRQTTISVWTQHHWVFLLRWFWFQYVVLVCKVPSRQQAGKHFDLFLLDWGEGLSCRWSQLQLWHLHGSIP